MSGSELLVVLAAMAGIAWVNWYFFLARRAPGDRSRGDGGARDGDA
jgi:hypothetical protein